MKCFIRGWRERFHGRRKWLVYHSLDQGKGKGFLLILEGPGEGKNECFSYIVYFFIESATNSWFPFLVAQAPLMKNISTAYSKKSGTTQSAALQSPVTSRPPYSGDLLK